MGLVQEIGKKSSFVTLKEDTHQYFDANGQEYGSVSSLLGKVKVPFDRQGQSLRSAKGNLGKGATPAQVKAEQARILTSWDQMRDSSTDWGTYVHNELEKFFLTGTCDSRVGPAAVSIARYVNYARHLFPELVMHLYDYLYAGTADLPVMRKIGRTPATSIMDIYDYKTNERKGIEFDSSYKDKHGEWKPGGKYLLSPLDHLEACNFNIYALQLSLYAYMAQLLFGVQIGRLGILFVDKDMKVTHHAIPYLKYEAKELFNFSKQVKSLPL